MSDKDIIYRIRTHAPTIDPTLVEDVIKRVWELEDERDEARREVCRLDSIWHAEHGNFQVEKFGPKALAEQRGWDCFKESN